MLFGQKIVMCDLKVHLVVHLQNLQKKLLIMMANVVGAQYDKDNLVEHVMVSDYDGIERIRQSKYIQSRIGNVYCEIKDKLNQDKLVGFCGSPCQVAGLYAYLGKDYDNLITMDFICRGMNSPKAYKAWLNEIEKKKKARPPGYGLSIRKGAGSHHREEPELILQMVILRYMRQKKIYSCMDICLQIYT